tara:strand:+ start:9101 stop:10033 length:933 start_codon:yes stop_codon:yes gene_type:complete
MGTLVNGAWHDKPVSKIDTSGAFIRPPRTFLNDISSKHPVFKPESGRYHLYASYACPWATRVLICRKLKELESHVSVDIVNPDLREEGWVFDDSFKGATKDSLHGFKFLRELYQIAEANITTDVTVPVLWDKKTNKIVNNESSQILRIMNSAFNGVTSNTNDYYPENFRSEIDVLNEEIYDKVNNGVYKSGFAKTQESYEEAVFSLFLTLDRLDALLSRSRFLLGERLTEVDIRLIPTLLRFDVVYVSHFKCNLRRIIDYKNLSRYVADMLEIPAVRETHSVDHIKRHYFCSHDSLNPHRIIPVGPDRLY